jgi:hypothetical protein
MICRNCGAPVPDDSKFCAHCGTALEWNRVQGGAAQPGGQQFGGPQFTGQQGGAQAGPQFQSAEFSRFTGQQDASISPKSRLAALLLCFFLGYIGAHRFYAEKIGTGILTIITFGGFFGLWPFIDLIIIIVGGFTDKQGLKISRW